MALFETIIGGAITGLGAGLGTTVGSYFSNKLIISHLDKLEKKIVKRKKRGV